MMMCMMILGIDHSLSFDDDDDDVIHYKRSIVMMMMMMEIC